MLVTIKYTGPISLRRSMDLAMCNIVRLQRKAFNSSLTWHSGLIPTVGSCTIVLHREL